MIYQSEKTVAPDFTEKNDGAIKYIEIKNVKGFSVAKTFDCGQCFRFEPVTGTRHESEFSGVAYGRFFSVAQDGETLYIYNCDADFYEKYLCSYLSLDTDYEEIRRDIATRCPTEYMLSVMERGEGIRILRQERWEALCSFIISQNNNIPRIKKIIRVLSERCGAEVDVSLMSEHGAAESEYAFPTPESVLALGVDGLRELRVGFRASYIYDAAEKVSLGALDLDDISALPTAECIDALCSVKGVGLKVASCTALFGMEKYDAFPIDVWIRRVLLEKFPNNFDPSTLGEFAGIAQQYMFYGARFD
ncbi:MAG: DNA-3-methyladenine glycosylase 2 family protein [Ruminococcaceae bacterium]|nr:DNA-3-methyladenine glycosylase 2 family protein [Oscillospiraceae bacterium]